jgi:hypothetical protein
MANKKTICISSDIELSHLILDIDFLIEVTGTNFVGSIKHNPVIQLRDEGLKMLQNNLAAIIESTLARRKDPDPVTYKKLESGRTVEFQKQITDIKFNDKAFKLDLRDDEDFKLCARVDLFSMATSSLNLSGSLSFFDRDLFTKHEGSSIIGYLRNNPSLNKIDIEIGLKGLWQRLAIQNVINDEILTNGLNNLTKYGLVGYDKSSDKYRLTARGLMFW